MSIRTTRSRVTFALPFVIHGVDGELGPGTYDVETEEEITEGLLHTVYRRVMTVLYVSRAGATRGYVVDPEELEGAQRSDQWRNLPPPSEQDLS